MTRLEAGLRRMAADIIPPVGASMAACLVRDGRHGVYFLVDGRFRSEPVALFDTPREAINFAAYLNGERPARRPGRHDLAELGGSTSESADAQPGASVARPTAPVDPPGRADA